MIMASDAGGMSNRGLDALIKQIGTDIKGQLGFWEFTAHGWRLCCITDESHNRMRLMTSIADKGQLTPELLTACMQANFDRALDARYCLSGDTLWGAFIHPLRSLEASLFLSACSQVAMLGENFGTTFSSGELRFGA